MFLITDAVCEQRFHSFSFLPQHSGSYVAIKLDGTSFYLSSVTVYLKAAWQFFYVVILNRIMLYNILLTVDCMCERNTIAM